MPTVRGTTKRHWSEERESQEVKDGMGKQGKVQLQNLDTSEERKEAERLGYCNRRKFSLLLLSSIFKKAEGRNGIRNSKSKNTQVLT